jgi:hypothetical protein
MKLLKAIGLTAVAAVFLYPLGYLPWVAEQQALASKANTQNICPDGSGTNNLNVESNCDKLNCDDKAMRVIPCEQLLINRKKD